LSEVTASRSRGGNASGGGGRIGVLSSATNADDSATTKADHVHRQIQ